MNLNFLREKTQTKLCPPPSIFYLTRTPSRHSNEPHETPILSRHTLHPVWQTFRIPGTLTSPKIPHLTPQHLAILCRFPSSLLRQIRPPLCKKLHYPLWTSLLVTSLLLIIIMIPLCAPYTHARVHLLSLLQCPHYPITCHVFNPCLAPSLVVKKLWNIRGSTCDVSRCRFMSQSLLKTLFFKKAISLSCSLAVSPSVTTTSVEHDLKRSPCRVYLYVHV